MKPGRAGAPPPPILRGQTGWNQVPMTTGPSKPLNTGKAPGTWVLRPVHLLWTGTGWDWDNHRAIQTVTKGNKALEPPPPPTKASHQGFWADGPAQQVPAQIHPPSSKRASRPPPQDPGQLSLDPARASEGPHQCHPNTPAPNEDKKVLEQMGMPQTSCSPRQDGPFQGPGRGAWVPFPFQGGGSSVIVQNEIQRKPQWEDTRREVVFTLPDPKLSPCRPSPHTP